MIQNAYEAGAALLCEISVGQHSAQGISVNIPGTALHILQVRCRRGMLFCGLFAKDVLERLDFPAAVFSAPEFSDMMERKPVFLTKAALDIGASMDMTGEELVAVFDQP